MKTLKILLASIAIPALFAAGAYAGTCCKKGDEDKKETSAFELNCGKKGDDDKKETSVFDQHLGCGKKGDDEKKDA